MQLRILNHRGHDERTGTVEDIAQEVERFMNAHAGRYSIVAEKPGEAAVHVSGPAAVRDLEPEATVTLLPVMAGG